MQIELLTQGKFTTSGNSVLKMMQNNSIPALDLIVRESVQNSLDAALPNVKNVFMNFRHSDFDVVELSNYFPDIKDQLLERFGGKTNKYLSIRDMNTVGLTGDLAGEFGINDKDQNLGKLVFHIMKAQDQEGAGGSWGIGKTVYYRVGVGLTIYYSRIKLSSGKYEERLVAALVENENKKDGLLKSFNRNLGVAFFGENYSNGKIQAITDEKTIHEFLDVFKIPYFANEDTGTEIIIPFVDDQKLLDNNKLDDNRFWWEENVEYYLKVALLRWYFPRMSEEYKYGAKLIVTVNDSLVAVDNENTPVYGKLQELYNACYSDVYANWIKKERISRKSNVANSTLGYFVYGNVTKDDLNMLYQNLPNPYEYSLLSEANDCDKPLIAFIRKPGMVVSYQIDGKGIGSIKNTDKNSYILGLFALNSTNKIISNRNRKINLDEYVRLSEKSDHTSWEDYSIDEGDKKILIIRSIYTGIENALSNEYGDKEEISGNSSLNTNLAKKFAKLLLPPEGYSDSGSTKVPKKEGGRKGSGLVFNQNRNKIDFVEQKFSSDGLYITYRILIQHSLDKLEIRNVIKTINGEISVHDYEENIGNWPCDIAKTAIRYKLKDNKGGVKFIDHNNETLLDSYKVNPILNNEGNCVGLDIIRDGNFVPIVFDLKFLMKTNDKLLQINFDFKFKEDIK